MKINNIKINAYGKLKEKEINFSDNINLIYGKNESGKSTLLNFIKNIFYGISKNKNGKEISDYEKFLPWEGENFSGKIKYELNNGKKIEIYRDFHKKNPKIFDENIEDISHEFKIDKKDGSQFFYEQTGVNEQTYLSTILTAQQDVVLDRSSQNILLQKVANLGGTGDDKVSFQKAIEKLNKRQLEEVGTNRTQDRPINILHNRRKELEVVLKDEKIQLENIQNLEKQKFDLEEELKREKRKNNIFCNVNMLTKKIQLDIEKNNLKNKIKNENEQKVEKIIQEKNELIKNNLQKIEKGNELKNKKELKNKIKKKIKINYFIFGIILLMLIIINIFNFKFIQNKIINYLFLLLIPIEICIFIFYNLKNNKKIKQIEKNILQKQENEQKLKEKLTIFDTQIKLLKEEIQKQQEEICNEEKQINIERQKIKGKYIYENNELKLEELLKDHKRLEEVLQNSNQKIINYQLELNSIQYEEKNISNKLEEYIYLKEELEDIEEKLIILEEKNKYFNITKELLEKAYNKMKNNVTPKFTQNLSNIIEKISNGKYKKVAIHEQKGLIVELENGEYVSANVLSTGTIDQLYLSLRLSMLNEISEEKLPIILDESFAYFDEERLKNILLFLSTYAKEHQIILFTCTNREKELLDSIKVEYKWIEL